MVGVAPVGQHMRRVLRDSIAWIIGCRVEMLIGLRVRLLVAGIHSAAVLVRWNSQSRKREYSKVTDLKFNDSGTGNA